MFLLIILEEIDELDKIQKVGNNAREWKESGGLSVFFLTQKNFMQSENMRHHEAKPLKISQR